MGRNVFLLTFIWFCMIISFCCVLGNHENVNTEASTTTRRPGFPLPLNRIQVV